jgi:hypothetical protein
MTPAGLANAGKAAADVANAVDRAVPAPVKRGLWRWLKARLGLEPVERDPERRKATYRAEGERIRSGR